MREVISDLAHGDLDQIESWYFEQANHLPDLFYDNFEELLIFIGQHPNAGSTLKKS